MPSTDVLPSSLPAKKVTLFLDCEFTSIEDPHLLSLGLVSDSGEEFYAELVVNNKLHELANEFVHDTVLTQWGRMPHVYSDYDAMGVALSGWLQSLEATKCLVCYDYHTDMDLMEWLLQQINQWFYWEPKLEPTHVGYLWGTDCVEEAMEASWEHSFKISGLERHHALADARALKQGFHAMHDC